MESNPVTHEPAPAGSVPNPVDNVPTPASADNTVHNAPEFPGDNGKGVAFGRGVAFLDTNIKNRTVEDVCFLMLFVVCTLGVIGLSIESSFANPLHKSGAVDMLWIALGVSFLWGQVWLLLTRYCAKEIAYIGVALCMVTTGFACYSFAVLALNSLLTWATVGYWICCVTSAISALLILFFFCMHRHKLAVSIALLECSAKALMTEPMMYVVAVLVVVCELMALLFFTWGLDTILAWEGYDWLAVFLVFYLYWLLWVVDGIMRVTIGGGVFIWYFTLGDPGRYHHCSLMGCLFRALTTSLGPVARGSFFLSTISLIVSTLNMIQRKLDKGGGNCLVCLLKTCVCCLKGACLVCLNMMEFVTDYAYIYVGAKGCDFKTAGQDVNGLLSKYGMTAVMSDVLTRWISRLGQLLGVAFSVLCMYAYASSDARSYDSVRSDGVVFMTGVFLSYIIMATTTAITDCGVDAMLVCYAIDQDQSKDSGTTFAPQQLQKVLKGPQPPQAAV